MKDRTNLANRAPALVSVLLLGVLAWVWWCTASSTSSARISLLATIEPYGFAVYEQLVYNFATTGTWEQTIHRGYTNDWMWSGHRAPILPLVAQLYGLSPSPWTLSFLQIAGVLAGVVPAALIGRRTLKHAVGLLLGGLVYLGSPAVLEIALQDYQDVAFALPALVFGWWALGERHWALAPVGIAVMLLPREEMVPIVPIVAALALPLRDGSSWLDRLDWKGRGLRLGLALASIALFSWVLETWWPLDPDHNAPAAGSLSGMWSIGAIQWFGALFPEFYVGASGPLSPLILLSPAALPYALLLVHHMSIPHGHGIGRHWSDHAHHVAPLVAFAAIGAIEGLARVLRALDRPSPVRHARWLLAVAVAGYLGWQWTSWGHERNWVVATAPSPGLHLHPAWELMRHLGPDDVPIVPADWALVASARPRSYTIGESLPDKAGSWGLGAGTHAIVSSRDYGTLARIQAMDGATLVDAIQGVQLWTWAPNQREPAHKVTRWTDPGFWSSNPPPPGLPPMNTFGSVDPSTVPEWRFREWRPPEKGPRGSEGPPVDEPGP